MMATLFVGYLTLKTRSLQVALLIGGISLAILGNLIRSLYLSLTANSKGLQAIDKVHDEAGWSILVFTAAGVIFLSWLLARLEKWAARTARDTMPSAAEMPAEQQSA